MHRFFTYFCYRCETHYGSQINHLCNKEKPKKSVLFLKSDEKFSFPYFGHKKNEMIEKRWQKDLKYYLIHYQIIRGKLSAQGVTLFSPDYRILTIWRHALLYQFSDHKMDITYGICKFSKKSKKIRLLTKYLPLPLDLHSIVLDYMGRYTGKTYKLPQKASFMNHGSWLISCHIVYCENKVVFRISNYVTKQYFPLTFYGVQTEGILRPILQNDLNVKILISKETRSTIDYFILWGQSEESILVLPLTFDKRKSKWIFFQIEEIIIPFPNKPYFQILFCYERKPVFVMIVDQERYLVKLERNLQTHKLNMIILFRLESDDIRFTLLQLHNNCEMTHMYVE